MFGLAGLWDAWKSPAGDWLQSFSIITVQANTAMSPIHDRMPAILSPQDYDEWLDRGEVERAPIHLLRPFPENHTADPRSQSEGRQRAQPGRRLARPAVRMDDSHSQPR
jgi:putative SOS response-associated peptidase YedK